MSVTAEQMQQRSPMVVVELAQNTPEWLEWRAGGVGASDAPTIMGENPWKSPAQLWAEKVGLVAPPDLSGNPHVQRGNRFEDEARMAFEADFQDFAVPLCGQHPEISWLRASFDGILAQGQVLEIKCPSPKRMTRVRTLAEGQPQAPNQRPLVGPDELEQAGLGHYHAQVQHQLLVADAAFACLYVYDVEAKRGYGFWIAADEAYQERLLEAEREFWRRVRDGEEPPLDPERDVFSPEVLRPDVPPEQLDTLPADTPWFRWQRAEASWLEINNQIKALEAEIRKLKEGKAKAEAEMVALMGDHLRAEGLEGLKITRFTKRGTLDYRAALERLLPDLEPERLEVYRKPSSAGVRFTPPRRRTLKS